MSQTLVVDKGALQPNQLHEELLAEFPEWTGDKRVVLEHTDTEIRIKVPDEADLAKVREKIAAHVPRPPKDWKKLRKEAIDRLQLMTNLSDDHLRALGFER